MFVSPPFALFSLVDLATETISSVLQKAHDGSTVDTWWFHLVSSLDYTSAPQKLSRGALQEGTTAPIDPAFRSPVIGSTPEEVANWLINKPRAVDLDISFFAVLDVHAKAGQVTLVRIGDSEGKGHAISCVTVPDHDSSLLLAGMEYGTWEENFSEMRMSCEAAS